MTDKFMADPVGGDCAFFTEIGTSGAFDDPTAARNAPLASPASHLSNVKFHSGLDHFEVMLAGSTSITHALVPALTTPPYIFGSTPYGTNADPDDNLIVDFTSLGLSYVPFVLVAVGTAVLYGVMPVQTSSGGAARYACPYVSTTSLRLATIATIGAVALAADAVTYEYLIFKQPPAAFGNVLFDFNPTTGVITMGKGKFSSNKSYLQVVPGGSPFSLSLGETCDLNNGAPKYFNADGTTVAPVPAALTVALSFLDGNNTEMGGEVFGASLAYGGSATAPATVAVQAP